jgi:hypothetical protein
MPPFIVVSLPLTRGRRDLTWELLQDRTSMGGHQLSSNSKLDVPELRVGTLDTLMQLSDDMMKISNSVEAITSKIRRTVVELAGPDASASLKVENLPVEAYMTRFKWDESKFPTRRPLKESIDKIGEIMGHIEDDLKVGGRAAGGAGLHGRRCGPGRAPGAGPWPGSTLRATSHQGWRRTSAAWACTAVGQDGLQACSNGGGAAAVPRQRNACATPALRRALHPRQPCACARPWGAGQAVRVQRREGAAQRCDAQGGRHPGCA